MKPVPPGHKARGDHERRNRAHWDRKSDRYEAGRVAERSAAPDAWGAWRIPEAALRLLPDVAGKDVLELGCGAGQWSVWLTREGARVTGLDLSGRRSAPSMKFPCICRDASDPYAAVILRTVDLRLVQCAGYIAADGALARTRQS